MEPKFINTVLQTEKVLREMQFAALGKLRTIVYSVVIAFVTLTTVMLYCAGVLESAIMLTAADAALILVGFVRPILAARQQAKRNLVLTGSDTPSSTVLKFYDDRLVTFNTSIEKEISFKYDRFKKFKKTKNLFLLALPERLYMMIDRKGFSEGSAEEFEKFIKEK